MMKTSRAVWNPLEQELYAAPPGGGDDVRRIHGIVSSLDIIAGDDVRVTVTSGRLDIQPLTDHPLLLRNIGDGEVRIRTQFEPDADIVIGELKRGEPMRFEE
jgi:hypothetical protein